MPGPRGGHREKLSHGVDFRTRQTGPDPAGDAGQVPQLKMRDLARQHVDRQPVEARGLVQFRRDLGQKLVGRDPNRRCQRRMHLRQDRALHRCPDLQGAGQDLLRPGQPAGEFIHGMRPVDRQNGVDRRPDTVVILDEDVVFRRPKDDAGAKFACLGHAGAHADAAHLGLAAGGDQGGAGRIRRHHPKGAAHQHRLLRLTDRGKVGVHVEEQGGDADFHGSACRFGD